MSEIVAGTLVRRNCPGILGHDSTGIVLRMSDVGTAYWVRIIEGRNRMEGWTEDAWAVDWCEPVDLSYIQRYPTPTWEL